MDTARPDSRPSLGWPWDGILDALLRWQDARGRVWAAQVAGDVNALRRAELDQEEAQSDWHAARAEVTRQWLLGLRLAIETEPTQLAVLLGQLPAADTVTEAIAGIEDRIDAAEDAIVNLESGAVYR
jgi:hypothetical protein